MEQAAEKTTGWRGSADLWLAAAYRALVEGGVEAVRVGPLAAGLGLSRTSFYGHYGSREDLLEALLARWDVVNTGNLLARAQGWAASLPEAVLNLFDCWIDPVLFDPRLDMAVRAWGQADPGVWTQVEEADRRRIAAVTGMFTRFGMDMSEADVRACTLYYTQIGYFALRVREDLARRIDRMPQYVTTFCGQSPGAADIARFRARHGV